LTEPVALYVDPNGPYPGIVGEWYDAARDARTYQGAAPVVAHPPCGPWSRLRNWCKHQDAGAGIHAFGVVRRTGGCLEHPAESRLWEAVGAPRPGAGPDAHGGWTLAIEQWHWGHDSVKPTWIYVVGVDPQDVPPMPYRDPSERPASDAFWGLDALERRLSPPALAVWLVELASRSRLTCGRSINILIDPKRIDQPEWARVFRAVRSDGQVGTRGAAARLGLSQTRLSRLERGIARPSADDLVALSAWSGLSLDLIAQAARQ
jgi:hypothetical protein